VIFRPLGNTGLTCSVIAFGCSGPFARLEHSTRLVNEACELGINVFDTADSYRESELVLGRALGSKRQQVLIATKAGYKFGGGGFFDRLRRSLARKLPLSQRDYSPKYLERRLVGSLRRLGTDYVDLFQLHSPPPEKASAELGEFLQRCKRKGYCRYVGVSVHEPEDAKAFFGMVDCFQIPYNARQAQRANPILDECAKLGVGVLARQPFDRGRFFEGPGTARDAIRFALRDGVSTVLCGTSSIEHLRLNVSAV
jgi:aryl-alcohol dehydrogenase-like predicted oxidoreductase